jgi:hypothetical protein
MLVLVDDSRPSGATQAAFVTPRDIQRELRIGERLRYKLLRAQAIPNVRVNGMYRIRREDLNQALENGSVLEVSKQ